MTDQHWYKLAERGVAALEAIATHLGAMALSAAPQAPSYRRPLSEYAGFDWGSIGASVIADDKDGATVVDWGGYQWTRRSPQNKYRPAVYFSRPAGKDAEGRQSYLRLITFADADEPEALSERMAGKVNQPGTVSRPAAPQAAPARAQAAPQGRRPAQPARQAQAGRQAAPQGHRAARRPRYDPLSDARLKSISKPSEALALEGFEPGPTAFHVLAKLAGLDKGEAASLLDSFELDYPAAIRELDKHAF